MGILVVFTIHAAAVITYICSADGYTVYLLGRLLPGHSTCKLFFRNIEEIIIEIKHFLLAPLINNFECLPN